MIETISDENNGLRIEEADEDGIQIIESAYLLKEKNKVYVYYSEIDQLIQKLRKAKFDWSNKNEFGEHSSHSEKNFPNAISQYKTFGNIDNFELYKKYIRSDEWQQKRKERLALDNHRCKNCGGRRGLEVHHKNYDSLFNENVSSDLITQCKECHDKITDLNRKKKKMVVDIA